VSNTSPERASAIKGVTVTDEQASQARWDMAKAREAVRGPDSLDAAGFAKLDAERAVREESMVKIDVHQHCMIGDFEYYAGTTVDAPIKHARTLLSNPEVATANRSVYNEVEDANRFRLENTAAEAALSQARESSRKGIPSVKQATPGDRTIKPTPASRAGDGEGERAIEKAVEDESKGKSASKKSS